MILWMVFKMTNIMILHIYIMINIMINFMRHTMINIMINLMIHLMTYIMNIIMISMMINVMTDIIMNLMANITKSGLSQPRPPWLSALSIYIYILSVVPYVSNSYISVPHIPTYGGKIPQPFIAINNNS